MQDCSPWKQPIGDQYYSCQPIRDQYLYLCQPIKREYYLCFTEWYTLASTTLALLNTVGSISHVLRLGTLGADSGALRLLLTGGVVCSPALGVDCHVLTHVAAGRVLVAADGVLSQLAVLITARISVF